jgi:hypothetical protein
MFRISFCNQPPKIALQTDVDPLPIEQARRLSKKRKAAALLVATTALSPYTTLIGDILRLHAPTAQEQVIASALDSAYDTSYTAVRCLSPEERTTRYWQSDTVARGLPLTHLVWLRTEDCDILTSLRQRPIDITQDTSGDSVITAADVKKVRDAVHNAAHEASHSILNVSDESAAECFGVQTAGALAVQLGSIPASQIDAWRHEEILSREYEHWKDRHKERYQVYAFDARCEDGKVLDLNPSQVEEFPTDP